MESLLKKRNCHIVSIIVRNNKIMLPVSSSSLKKDVLYKKHLDKAFYKKVLLPFSILVLVIYFGSLIFTSLRDSTLGGRIVVAVIGAFIYKLIQDLSIGVFISYGLPVLIGVLIPSIILIAFSIFSYKKI